MPEQIPGQSDRFGRRKSSKKISSAQLLTLAVGDLPLSRQSLAQEYRIETLATGLEHPWSIGSPRRQLLVTERAGRLRIVDADDCSPTPEGLPEIFVSGQADCSKSS